VRHLVGPGHAEQLRVRRASLVAIHRVSFGLERELWGLKRQHGELQRQQKSESAWTCRTIGVKAPPTLTPDCGHPICCGEPMITPRHLGVKGHVRERKDHTPKRPIGSPDARKVLINCTEAGGYDRPPGGCVRGTAAGPARTTANTSSTVEATDADPLGTALAAAPAANRRRHPRAGDTSHESAAPAANRRRSGTRDEQTLEVSRRLFDRARTPAAMAALPERDIETLLHGSTFRERKARQIRDIARRVEAEHEGTLPCDEGVLRSFAGVGPKCANLVLGIACGEPRVSADVHVHRVVNRW